MCSLFCRKAEGEEGELFMGFFGNYTTIDEDLRLTWRISALSINLLSVSIKDSWDD